MTAKWGLRVGAVCVWRGGSAAPQLRLECIVVVVVVVVVVVAAAAAVAVVDVGVVVVVAVAAAVTAAAAVAASRVMCWSVSPAVQTRWLIPSIRVAHASELGRRFRIG
jgi:hypothetical protein